MDSDSTPRRVDLRPVTKIVASYVGNHALAPDQLSSLIISVQQAISQLSKPIQPEQARTPAVPVRRSVQRDHVICLECGYRGQMLRRHLSVAHGLEPAEYRVRWKLPADHPITAPAYSERRSTMAKRIGLGRKPQEAIAAPPTPEVVAPSPKRRGRKLQSAAAE